MWATPSPLWAEFPLSSRWLMTQPSEEMTQQIEEYGQPEGHTAQLSICILNHNKKHQRISTLFRVGLKIFPPPPPRF